jgi:DNA-binding LacI/PurR family transcriptional regulator
MLSNSRSRAPAIATELRQRVMSGHWKPRQQIHTEHQLAREFGVSRGTVIRSLRELEREGLIWTRRGEGRYVSDFSQRPKTETIGVVVADLNQLGHPVLGAELAGIRQVCSGANYHLQIFAINKSGPGDMVARVAEQLDPTRLDGAIIISWVITEEKIIDLSRRIPIVTRIRPLGMPRIGCVIHDIAGGMMDAATHLVQLGHTKIALVTVGEDKMQGLHQRAGVRLGMRPLLTSARGRMDVLQAEINRDKSWLPRFREILSAPSRPTAVIFGSDDLAESGIEVIKELGLRVPQDLSVASQNDTLAPPAVPVPLTTVRYDYEESGRRAARLLLRMVSEPFTLRESEVLPTEFIVRESTAAPPTLSK